MKPLPFMKIDAFAEPDSSGNPAACIELKSPEALSPQVMLQIARELKGFVSEVVYLAPQGEGFWLRYYSSECEVDFCGHATIAVMYHLLQTTPRLRERATVPIWIKGQELCVYNELATQDAVYILAPPPRRLPLPVTLPAVARALGTAALIGADSSYPLDLVNAGLNTLLAPLPTLQDCLNLKPSLETLKAFCKEYGIDIVLTFSRQVAYGGSHYRTRVFAPKYGYLEDPATGSGNAALGSYLLSHGLWDGSPLLLEQNGVRDHPNFVKLSTKRVDGANRVAFGGGAVLRISGEYHLSS